MFGGQTKNPPGRILLIEADAALGSLYADIIATHCPGLRIDVCRPDESALLEDNAGGADVAVCSCGTTDGCRGGFEMLRRLMTLRPCLVVLMLVPADRPQLADEALGAGASDVLLRAPGYLDQLAVSVRKNVALSRARLAENRRAAERSRSIEALTTENTALRHELSRRATVQVRMPERARPDLRVRMGDRAKVAWARRQFSQPL